MMRENLLMNGLGVPTVLLMGWGEMRLFRLE